jgi:hypothetical protein
MLLFDLYPWNQVLIGSRLAVYFISCMRASYPLMVALTPSLKAGGLRRPMFNPAGTPRQRVFSKLFPDIWQIACSDDPAHSPHS